jgi:hypothetical protein
MKSKEKFNKKLLVEGKDDQHVIFALCEKFQIKENFDVIDCEGIDGLIEEIPLRFKQSNPTSIGMIVDADINIGQRWHSLSDLLSKQGFIVPKKLPNEGLIVSKDEVKVGIWIMPNNQLDGMLEDFIKFLVPKNDKLLSIAQNTLANIEHQKLNNYSEIHHSKALIHTWLAWQESPVPMGLGITKRYLTTDEATCQSLVNWLKILFDK